MDEKKIEEIKEEDLKMRAGIWVHPIKAKEIIIALLMLITILASIVPFINIINKPVLWLGMPAMMTWSIIIVLASFVILQLARKWRVF